MPFNSFSFLAFFGILSVVYYLLPHRFRWPLLLIASLGFYATFQVRFLVLLTSITLISYWAGLSLGKQRADARRHRLVLTASVISVVGALLTFKYYDFLVDALGVSLTAVGLSDGSLPFPRFGLVVAVGLSFYTFSCVSYLVDVAAGRLPPERHLGHFTLYVSFFPKLIAGPIERARPFLSQLRTPVAFSARNVTEGLQQILWGLFKKVVIADRLAAFVDNAYALPAFTAPADLLLGTYFFAFQLYCDFSGYSDMAIGASKVLGIDLMDNFRRPYFSKSVPEFWSQRWHLSLSAWFRDYTYIPMGGSRVSQFRRYGNIMVVFLLSGLWHGANWTFAVWGGLNGFYQIVSIMTRSFRERVRVITRVPPILGNFLRCWLTFHLILVSWVFFRAATLADAMTILSRIVESIGTLPMPLLSRVVTGDIFISIILIAALMLMENLDERQSFWERLAEWPVYVRWGVYYAILVLLAVIGKWELQEFVYMQF